jgi:hypothetical protein
VANPGTRTDPTLYQWDRLSPEQQQAVLDTLGALGAGAKSPHRAAVVLTLLALLAVVVVIGAYALVHGF